MAGLGRRRATPSRQRVDEWGVVLGRSLKALWLRDLCRIRPPFAVPFVFSGLKMAIIGIVLFQIVAIVERVFFPWSIPEDRTPT